MDPRIAAIENALKRKTKRPDFRVGDTVRVFVRIREDNKSRVQPYEGVVISRRGASSREMFSVRRISYGEGIERTFPLYSPLIEKILVVKRGDVRRAKLYYLRKKIGKGTRIEERFAQTPESPTASPAAPPVRPEPPAPQES